MLTGTGRQHRDREVYGARREQQVQSRDVAGARGEKMVGGGRRLQHPSVPPAGVLRRPPCRHPAAPRARRSGRPLLSFLLGRPPPAGSPRTSKDGGHSQEPRTAAIVFRWVLVQEAGRCCGEDLGERWRVAGEGGRGRGEREAAEGVCRRRDGSGRGVVGEIEQGNESWLEVQQRAITYSTYF
jgi:hypothetical protein